MSDTDQLLLEAVTAGDKGAFRELFDRHHAAALRLARRILGHREDAEDATQDAFVAVHRSAGAYRSESTFSTWFYRIVVNSCLKYRRGARTDRVDCQLDDLASTAGAPHDGEAERALDAALVKLPMRQRMVFALVAIEGVRIEDVAGILGLQGGTVRYHLCKARENLRRALRPWLVPRDTPSPNVEGVHG